MNKNNGIHSTFLRILDLDNSLYKTKIKKSFQFHSLRWTSFLMIRVSTLYDEYIDRRKLSEQKNPCEYIVLPPLGGVGTKTVCHSNLTELTQLERMKLTILSDKTKIVCFLCSDLEVSQLTFY